MNNYSCRLSGIVLGILCFGDARAADCIPQQKAEAQLIRHGYSISALSVKGAQRVAEYAFDGRPNAADAVAHASKGFFAQVRQYRVTDQNGVGQGYLTTDRAIAAAYAPDGECVGMAGGTIEQVTKVLDGSASRLNDALQ